MVCVHELSSTGRGGGCSIGAKDSGKSRVSGEMRKRTHRVGTEATSGRRCHREIAMKIRQGYKPQ